MYFYCEDCKKEYPLNTHSYKCDCGGMFRLHKDVNEAVAKREISLGEFVTPLLPLQVGKLDFLLKMEHLLPTGSFKDRGACSMVNALHELGIKKIALDSSGNAGAAIAAYAAAAGMECTVYVPDDISQEQVKQIKSYGAKIVKVANGRMRACAAVKQNLGDAYYASHVYNPLFFEGIKSMAHELYEQLGHHVPDYIFMPVGNGTMLLGLFLGFMEIGRLPHFVAVQSSKCAPLYEAYHEVPGEPKRATIAEAIHITQPKRLKDMVQAIKASGGDVVKVLDKDILKAQKYLSHHGVYVEMTSAAALAGAEQFFAEGKPDNYKVVIPLTGNGLKR